MPRSLPAAALAAALLVPFAVPSSARAALPTIDQVVAVAESYGLACDPPAADGGHVSCAREIEGGTSNIDVSVTLNVVDAAAELGFASIASYAEPAPGDYVDLATDVASLFCEGGDARVAIVAEAPQTDLSGCSIRTSADATRRTVDVDARPGAGPNEPPQAPSGDWSPTGTSTYEGSWTLTAYEADTDGLEPDIPVGSSVPGTLEIACTPVAGVVTCGFAGSREGDLWWSSGVEVVGEGQVDGSDEHRLDNCPEGQVQRSTYTATYGPESATAAVEQVTEPRTCEEGSPTLYMADGTWSFSGSLVAFEPAHAGPADGLDAYLLSYGLVCDASDAETACELEITDEDGLDATYSVVIRTDDAGGVVSIDAVAASLDESMPSDALGFLRGVAERAPVPDAAGLVTWLDAVVVDPTIAPYADDPWAASWSDSPVGDGRAWALTILRTGAGASPAPSEGAGGGPAGAPAAPRASSPPFADAVPTIAEVSADPVVLLQSAALALLVVFLMPFPAQLFNSTLEANEDEVRRILRLDRLRAVGARLGGFWASWPGVATFAAAAALLYGFLDPTFGPDLRSAGTFVGLLFGIGLVTAVFAIPLVLAHRAHRDRWAVKVVPISLVVGIGCVLVSRVVGFQPGYLYGLLIGLVFARELTLAEEGRATAVGAGLMLVVAFAAWIGLGLVGEGSSLPATVARTTLAALMVAGLEGVVFGLLPLRFLPGAPLYAWNRRLWAALLGVGAFAFFHILINPASGYLADSTRTPLMTALALLIGFGLASVAFWAWFRFRSPAPVPA